MTCTKYRHSLKFCLFHYKNDKLFMHQAPRMSDSKHRFLYRFLNENRFLALKDISTNQMSNTSIFGSDADWSISCASTNKRVATLHNKSLYGCAWLAILAILGDVCWCLQSPGDSDARVCVQRGYIY